MKFRPLFLKFYYVFFCFYWGISASASASTDWGKWALNSDGSYFQKPREVKTHWSVTPDEYNSAACRVLYPIATQDIEDELLAAIAKVSGPRTNYNKFGLNLNNQPPYVLEILNSLIEPVPTIFEDYDNASPSVKQKIQENIDRAEVYFKSNLTDTETRQSLPHIPTPLANDFSSVVPPSCHDVICAAKSIFGDEAGVYIFTSALIFKVNLSHLTGHRFFGTKYISPWTADEIKLIFSTLSTLPREMLLRKDFFQILKFDRNSNLAGNQNTAIADASGIFWNSWNELPTSEEKSTTIFHEYMHRFAEEHRLYDGQKRFKDWQKMADAHIKPHLSMPSHYASKATGEDIAESLTAYRFAPIFLRFMSPARYEFIKNKIFKGKEFIPGECEKFGWIIRDSFGRQQ